VCHTTLLLENPRNDWKLICLMLMKNKVQAGNVGKYLINVGCVPERGVGDNRPHLRIGVQGVDCNTLFDTGSEVTLMSKGLYNCATNQNTLQETSVSLHAANGTQINVQGVANVEFDLKGYRFIRPVMVMRGLKTGCIIGQDTMEAEGIIIDVGKCRITFARAPPAQTKYAVVLTKAYTLEPHSERMAYMKTIKSNPTCDTEVLVEPEMNTLPEGIHVSSSIATWSGKIPILISNVSDQPITLPRGKLVGEVGSISRSDQRCVRHNVEEVFKEGQTRPPLARCRPQGHPMRAKAGISEPAEPVRGCAVSRPK
jgi:hypothetical protein